MQVEEFADCLDWWNNREENERAWRVPMDEVLKYDVGALSPPIWTSPPQQRRRLSMCRRGIGRADNEKNGSSEIMAEIGGL
jgi:hypothetical protein